MSWKVRSSNRMLVLGLVFFVIGFIFMGFFPKFMSFSPNRVAGWLYVLLIAISFELGLFSIISVKMRDAMVVMAAFLVWSLILLVPVPEGYQEPFYGGSLILVAGIMMFHDKYRKSKQNRKA